MKQNTLNFYNVGLHYKKADVQIRSLFSVSSENQSLLLQEAKKQGLDGLFIISTCNRTELFGFAPNPACLIALICKYSKGSFEEFYSYANIRRNEEAISHLFEMGSGLDSQILGDYEIVGQLRDAYKQAKELEVTNTYLERLLDGVLLASKQVKNETKLCSGITSVSYAGVQYIIENMPDYHTKNILVYGLGRMGYYSCKHFFKRNEHLALSVVNRTDSKSEQIALEHSSISKVNFSDLNTALNSSDIIILATGAETFTITDEMITSDRDMLILDLSLPSNVDPNLAKRSNIRIVDVDELSKVTSKTLEIRQKEVLKAQEIIKAHQEDFYSWLNHRKLLPAIDMLKGSLHSIQDTALAFHRKNTDDFNEEVAQEITDRMIQQIVNRFAKMLKEDYETVDQTIDVIRNVFAKD